MPELLLEFFSEEIPARFQRRAADDLKKAVTGALVEHGLVYESAAAFATPRRLALTVTGLPAASPDTREERKGPKVGAPEQAVEGFVRAAGLASIADAKIQTDPKKGDFYVAVMERKGAPAPELIKAILPRIVADFPWAKPMRWGGGSMHWVRPLRAITATFGPEGEEPEVIEVAIEGLAASNVTYGHRFMAPEPIKVRRFDDYVQALEKAKVVLDLDRRKDIIRADATQLAFAQGLELIADEGLLEEVAGLVEWPVAMMGRFDEAFLAVPEEVIIATIRANQKCFCLRDGATGKLANRFVLVANLVAEDGGKTIVAGNERVIRARLADARFFYHQDLAARLESRLHKLDTMIFHEKLGTQGQRVGRIEALAGEIAPLVGADASEARRAARLAKADLVTEMVGEFPELQGLMGRYYATAQGESAAIADAIEAHYKPVGPSDAVPTAPVAIAVALADKLDMLTSFWSIGETPTGSKDPFALRRSALGVIRIITENRLALPLNRFVGSAGDLLGFFHDRLKVSLRDAGARHDLVDAVISADADDVLQISQRAAALGDLLDSADGTALLAGYKRAANILVAEEKKDGTRYRGTLDRAALTLPEETVLAAAVDLSGTEVDAKLTRDDYAGAVAALAALRAPVDAFFETVLVNDPDPAVRVNRLNLLARLRDTMHMVADFSKVAG